MERPGAVVCGGSFGPTLTSVGSIVVRVLAVGAAAACFAPMGRFSAKRARSLPPFLRVLVVMAVTHQTP